MDTKNFQSDFQLVGSRITEFSINNSYYRMTTENSGSKKISLDRKISEMYVDGDYICGLLEVSVEVYIKDNNEDVQNENQYNISLKMEGAFRASSQMPEEDFEKMLDINGCAALYSIARGFIMNTASQTMIEGQIILPLLNFFDISQSDNE